MKKEYIKPYMTESEVSTCEIIATSIPVGEDIENGATGVKPTRGEWGNLWK